MIHASEIIADQPSKSILVVSGNAAFAQCITEMAPQWADCSITSQSATFKTMNGHAAEVAFQYDAVLFDTNPDDADEFAATKALLEHRDTATVFIALTKSDLSITKARLLRDIGVDEVLPMSITEDGLKSVIDLALDARRPKPKVPESMAVSPAQVIAVTQARGGIGATTVAVNLACSLASTGSIFHRTKAKRVALLDFDLQFGNANVFLDVEDNGGFLKMIESHELPDERYLAGVLQRNDLGVDILCAPATVAPLQSISPEMVSAILDLLQQEYDHVVIDMPRALVDWIEPVIRRASHLVIVTDTSVPCIRQARRLMDFYREDCTDLPVDIVVNREKKPLFKSDHIREAERVLDTKLIHWLPDNPRIARKSVDLGQPVVTAHLGSDLGKALTRLSSALTTAPTPAIQPTS